MTFVVIKKVFIFKFPFSDEIFLRFNTLFKPICELPAPAEFTNSIKVYPSRSKSTSTMGAIKLNC